MGEAKRRKLAGDYLSGADPKCGSDEDFIVMASSEIGSLHQAKDVGLIIISDDPDDGPSIGPRGHGIRRIDFSVGIDAAVVWSGAWDDTIWNSIRDAWAGTGLKTVLVLTQPLHHAEWVSTVRGIPLLEIKP